MPCFSFSYIIKVNLSLLWGPHMKVCTGHLDCPPSGIQRQPQSLWVVSNPRLIRVAISTSYSVAKCRWPPALWTCHFLINLLANRGYKISKEKAQLCQSRVTYLGFVLEKEMRALGEDRIHLLLMFSLPKILKYLRVFWGVTGYCRIWILGNADPAKPIYQILKEAQKDPQPFIEWDDKSENAF
jgi:hypothetical protein